MADFWNSFCRDSKCSNPKSRACSPGLQLLTYPYYSCIYHALIILYGLLLIAMILFSVMRKRPLRKCVHDPAYHQCLSHIKKASAVINICVGVGYLGIGSWVLSGKLNSSRVSKSTHWWVLFFSQGSTWLIIGLSCIFHRIFQSRLLQIVSISTFLYGVISFFLSLHTVMAAKYISVNQVLDILSIVGATLVLLTGTLNVDKGEEAGKDPDQSTLNLPCFDQFAAQVTPFSSAGFISKLSLWWLQPLMKKGSEKILEEADIPKLRDQDKAESCYLQFLDQMGIIKQRCKSTKFSILWTILLCHWIPLVLSSFFAFVKVLAISAGPLLLKSFIEAAKGEKGFKSQGYILTILLFISKSLEAVAQRQWYFWSRLIGVKVKSLLIAIIYKKQLRLSSTARITISAGEIVNYINIDAQKVGEFPPCFHQIWTTLLQLCIALIILFREVRLAAITSLIMIALIAICSIPLGKLQNKFQNRLMVAQDARLISSTEALTNMKILKLYAWEKHFKNAIESLRKIECKWLLSLQLQKACNAILFWTSPMLVSGATFASCYFLKVPLHTSNVFTFVSALCLVQDMMSSIPELLGAVIEARVAFIRILMFLEAPELQELESCEEKGDMKVLNCAVLVKSADMCWNESPVEPTLRNIDLELKQGEKMALCGKVGAGKSTLLAGIMGELPYIHGGTVDVLGKIAYVSQASWIQAGTMRKNILFGSAMDDQKYQKTLEICSLLKDLELLPNGDMTEIGDRGITLSGGQKQRIQLARALYQDADIYLLDDPFSAVDATTATTLFTEYVMEALRGKAVLLVTHKVDFLPAFDNCLLMSRGEIIKNGPYHQLLSSSDEFWALVNAHNETAGAERLEQITKHKMHYNPSYTNEIVSEADVEKPFVGNDLLMHEEREVGDIGFKPYMQYLNQKNSYIRFFLAAISHLLFVGGQISQNSWMASNVDNPDVGKLKLVVVYLVIGLGSAISLFFRSILVVVLGMKSSKSLFSQLMSSLFHAPVSFYDSTPLGRILTRLSSDLSIVDLDLPFSLLFTVGATTTALANLGVLSIIAWQVLFVCIPVVYITIYLQGYYVTTAKELMRINATTKSFVANNLAESIAGAMTIRAFKQEERFFAEYLEIIDRNASPFFHSFAANDWLIERVGILGAIVFASTALCIVLLPHGTFGSGFIGMAIFYGLSLNTSLLFSIQNQTTLANLIISVERLNQYMNIPCEASEIMQKKPPENWPAVGVVEIQDLQIKYRPDAPLVLRGISCAIRGGDKVGIVGRTGSGKSTLIGALFRLVEPAGGKIIIDGIDIGVIGLEDLRSRLGIIPQDPVLFNGTVRYNLDPLSEHTNQELWEVLGKCQLRDAIGERELDSLVLEDGSNWSMGQRQLFCLGRALLRQSKVLVLDEATASIDNTSDMIIQATIRKEFAECTVIIVAHRIPTIMDCTKILGLHDGTLVEYDEPMKLLKRQDSLFCQLVKEYWSCIHLAEE